ncbi:MAG: hypothetical protein AB1483_02180 [Candidatus Zixiibacteriota bacterium]
MKRLVLLGIAAILSMSMLLIANCSNPLETDNGTDPNPNPNPIETETVFVVDTVSVIDTLIDTIYGGDTLTIIDTMYYVDTVFHVDTIFDGDTVIIVDTVIDVDTLYIIDTLIEIDTIIQIDTLINEDTVYVVDTINIVDTVTIVDTLYIVEPDPGGFSSVCSIIHANLREIIWMFGNEAGNYNLTFTATATRDFTFRWLIITVDGQEYYWNPMEVYEFKVDGYLDEDAVIRIKPDQPLLLGHEVDVCLKIEKPQQ